MKRHGFTLIEVLVATTIVAVLTAVGVTSFVSVNKRARDAKRKSDIEQIRSALEMFRADNGVYPLNSVGFTSASSLDTGDVQGLVSSYMPSIPSDPQSTTDVPKTYFYTPIAGTSGKMTSYCLCGCLEEAACDGVEMILNTCGSSPAVPPACNYAVKNP